MAGPRAISAAFATTHANSRRSRTSPGVAIPADRVVAYPWVGLEVIEDEYVSTRNLDQIGRTEDLYLGLSARLEAGFAATALGSTHDGLILNGKLQAGADLGNEQYLIHSLGFGRASRATRSRTHRSTGRSRYYLRQSVHRVFFASVSGTVTSHRDPEEQLLLGGDNGLRGYPLRYQAGDESALVTLEQRFYTDWQPLKLFNVGAAVFFDAGRTWGHDRLRRGTRGLAEGRRARPAPRQRALRPRQRAAHRSRVPAGSQQRHRQRAAAHRNAAVVLNAVPVPALLVVAPAGAACGLRRAGDGLRDHAARRAIARAVFFDAAHARWIGADSWVVERAAAHRRPLGDPRAAGARAGLSGSRPMSSATGARCGGRLHFFTIATLLSIGVVGLLKTRDERRLSVGPRAVRRPFPVRRAVRRPARRAACRPLLPCGSCQLRLCTARPILRVSRAARDAGEAGPWIGPAGRTDIRRGAAGTRRALRLARPVERVPRLDGHAVDLRIRLPRAACGNRRTEHEAAAAARRLAPDRAPCWPLRPRRRSCAGDGSAKCSTSCARRG